MLYPLLLIWKHAQDLVVNNFNWHQSSSWWLWFSWLLFLFLLLFLLFFIIIYLLFFFFLILLFLTFLFIIVTCFAFTSERMSNVFLYISFWFQTYIYIQYIPFYYYHSFFFNANIMFRSHVMNKIRFNAFWSFSLAVRIQKQPPASHSDTLWIDMSTKRSVTLYQDLSIWL